MSLLARHKIDSLAVIGVAAAFQWFFMFTKHDPGLRSLIPFGDDPYDALGSFATIVNILICPLLLWRTFRPYRAGPPSESQIHYLRRTQAAVPLAVLVTLAADGVAMARHPHMWIGNPSQNKLLAAFAAVALISAGALFVIRFSAPVAQQRKGATASSAIVAALFLSTLALYPERLIVHLSTHLLTVIIGDLLLFLPVSVLLRSLLPEPAASEHLQQKTRRASVYIWTAAMAGGLAIGVWLFLAEMTEGGAAMPPLRMRLFVASVYIGLTLAGTFIALVLLKRPLGLGHARAAQSN